MLAQSFADLRYFLSFFALFIGVFAVAITIIVSNDDLQDLAYPNAGNFGYVLIVLTSAIGQGDINNYVTSNHTTLTYVIWFSIVFVGNIIFMNFIIAVINTSYGTCMETMGAQMYRMKLEMIIERESQLSDAQLLNKEWFPNFIVIRRKTSATGQGNNLEGFVNQIKSDQ